MTWLPSYLEQQVRAEPRRRRPVHRGCRGWRQPSCCGCSAAGRTICSPPPAALRIARSYLIAGTQFVAAIAVIPVAMTDDLTAAIVGITVAVAASMGANAAYYAVNVDIVPDRAATALGIIGLRLCRRRFPRPPSPAGC